MVRVARAGRMVSGASGPSRQESEWGEWPGLAGE